jgi:uncharacterized protein
MKFELLCTRPIIKDDQSVDIEKGKLIYDNMTSELLNFDGTPVKYGDDKLHKCNYQAFKTSEQTPAKKSTSIRNLKIQLGLSCNYSCTYCSQRFVPNAPETNNTYVEKFLSNMDTWCKSEPQTIEFWGGEPFVYWKTLKPLAEQLREKFPKAKFLIITNGSILTEEIIGWIEKLDISVGISHDGPGQFVRGPDPLDDPEQKKIILELFKRRPDKVSFNSMINKHNMDREKIQQFFQNLLGTDQFSIGEGGFIDAYDEGGIETSLSAHNEHITLRKLTAHQIRQGKNHKFNVVNKRMNEWFESILTQRSAEVLGQKCGMDREDTISVDLRGNVLTCQNVSAVSTAPNGRSHLIGHVSNMDKVKLHTATHWSFREECVNCPVLQACKGSCMFLQKDLFKKSCDNAYSDHISFFAVAVEMLTGWLPYKIEAINYNLPEERMNIWGFTNV